MNKRPLAVMTIVQDEREFMGKWLSHYRRQGGDIFILHHQDPSGWHPKTARIELREPEGKVFTLLPVPLSNIATVIPVHRKASFDHEWLRDTVAHFYAFLLQSYDYVLFAEADELVCTWPGSPPLAEWLSVIGGRGRRIRATGYEVVHRPELGEPAVTVDEPWLANRSYWYRSELYSKTLLSRTHMRWKNGFHEPEQGHPEPIPSKQGAGLLLLHLHKVDLHLALAKSRRNAARRWSEIDRVGGAGWQNRLTTEQEMRTYFATNVDDNSDRIPWEPIPEALKELA